MNELVKCFLTGLAGIAGVCASIAFMWLAWPVSGWMLGCVFFATVCIGLGADMRGGRDPK